MAEIAKIISNEKLTHNVYQIRVEKPGNISYKIGQAIDISIHHEDFKHLKNTFSIASLPEDNYIEFVIKILLNQNKTLDKLASLEAGNEIILHQPFGGISYKGEGIFIAGGVGIAPFLPILRDLQKKEQMGGNKLIFANRTTQDLFLEEELKSLFGSNFITILSDEKSPNHKFGFVNTEIIQEFSTKSTDYFYLCGPAPMVDGIEKQLLESGVKKDKIIKEGF